jgi:dTDP-4-dehydrorhamnose 3,5-epimerase
MKILSTEISGVFAIEPAAMSDERGFFFESYHRARFKELGIDADFVQDNHSRSARHVLRGLHYQVREPQGKLVRVVAGEVYDVVVDIRRHSKTCGQWVSMELSSENKRILWIPPGFAHGFFVRSAFADFVYKTTTHYLADAQRTILWNDTDLNITWPVPDGVVPVLSANDASAEPFTRAELLP